MTSLNYRWVILNPAVICLDSRHCTKCHNQQSMNVMGMRVHQDLESHQIKHLRILKKHLGPGPGGASDWSWTCHQINHLICKTKDIIHIQHIIINNFRNLRCYPQDVHRGQLEACISDQIQVIRFDQARSKFGSGRRRKGSSSTSTKYIEDDGVSGAGEVRPKAMSAAVAIHPPVAVAWVRFVE